MEDTKGLDASKLLSELVTTGCKSASPEVHHDVRTEIVRCLQLLPHQRLRVRGPDGLLIYILNIPQHMQGLHFNPGIFLEADINFQQIINESDGEVVSLLGPWSIPKLLSEGKWPEAFLERGYMPENISKYLHLNAGYQY